MYFKFAIHQPLAEKYGQPEWLIADVRDFGVGREMKQQEICIYLTERLQDGTYMTRKAIHSKGRGLQQKRERLLAFLLRCSPQQFEEITTLSRWDWKYEGDDSLLKKAVEKLSVKEGLEDSS